jgi:hypothetical protein
VVIEKITNPSHALGRIGKICDPGFRKIAVEHGRLLDCVEKVHHVGTENHLDGLDARGACNTGFLRTVLIQPRLVRMPSASFFTRDFSPVEDLKCAYASPETRVSTSHPSNAEAVQT